MGTKNTLMLVFLVFVLGWLCSMFVANLNIEQPFSFGVGDAADKELNSPGDHIKENQIHVYDDRIVIDLKGAGWAGYTDTNSMDPLFDVTANGLEVKPQSTEDIHVGDVISYNSEYTDGLVVHRVTEIGEDSNGWFAIVKGDNNPTTDPGKVRLDDIHGILVGILY